MFFGGWLDKFCFVLIQFSMDRVNVEEFYEVYKGVVSEYNVSIKVNVKHWYLRQFVHLKSGTSQYNL